MGELGVAKAPVEEWEDVAIGLSDEEKICRLELATENMFDYHDIEKELDTIDVFEKGTFPIESDALVTGTEEGRRRMLKPASSSEKKMKKAAKYPQWTTLMSGLKSNVQSIEWPRRVRGRCLPK